MNESIKELYKSAETELDQAWEEMCRPLNRRGNLLRLRGLTPGAVPFSTGTGHAFGR